MSFSRNEFYLSALVFSIIFEKLPFMPKVGPVSLTDILLCFGVLLILLEGYKLNKINIDKDVACLSFFLFLIPVSALITGLMSNFPLQTLIFSVSMLLKFLFINVFVCFAMRNKLDMETCDYILKFYILVVFVVVTLQYSGFNVFQFDGSGSPAAFYHARNELVAILLPISIYITYKNGPNFFYLALSITTLAMTRGRTGLFLFLVVSVLILFSIKENRKYFPLIIAILLLFATLLPSEVYDQLYYRFVLSVYMESHEDRGSTGVRIVLYENILDVIQNRYTIFNYLFGLGETGFRELTRSFHDVRTMGYELLQPHNSYLGLFVNFGLVALCSYLCFIFSVFRFLYRGSNKVYLYVFFSLVCNLMFVDYSAKYTPYLMISIMIVNSMSNKKVTNQ